jgi:hypothetical protein
MSSGSQDQLLQRMQAQQLAKYSDGNAAYEPAPKHLLAICACNHAYDSLTTLLYDGRREGCALRDAFCEKAT